MQTSYSVVQAAFEWASTHALCCSRHILQSLDCAARSGLPMVQTARSINATLNAFMTISPLEALFSLFKRKVGERRDAVGLGPQADHPGVRKGRILHVEQAVAVERDCEPL